MAISSTTPPNTGDDWTFITSTTPTGSVTSVNFTSIPSYRKLMILDKGVLSGSTQVRTVRINNETTGYYYTRFVGATPALGQATNQIELSATTTSAQGFVIIDSCQTSNVKTFNAYGLNSIIREGIYLASAPVTQLNYVLTGTGVSASNTAGIFLYGAK